MDSKKDKNRERTGERGAGARPRTWISQIEVFASVSLPRTEQMLEQWFDP